MAVSGNPVPNLRAGQTNATGDAGSLFLKLFSGQVLLTFEQYNTALSRCAVRDISGGKSAAFPVVGEAAAVYHTAGQNILEENNALLQTIRAGERLIFVDKTLISPVFVPDIDELINHWDQSSAYATKCGQSLGVVVDQALYRVILKASRVAADALFTGSKAGAKVTAATSDTSGTNLTDAIYQAAQKMDEKDVPKENRYVAVSPAGFRLLLVGGGLVNTVGTGVTSALINKDVSAGGDFARRMLPTCAGMEVVVTNHLPTGNNVATTNQFSASVNNDYTVDATNTVTALAWQQGAVGTVRLMGMSMQMIYKPELQGTLILARQNLGHGILRPECAVEIAKT